MHINEGDFGVKILFVCHGNICRSAAAEMVLKQMAREAGRKDLQIASAAATREEIGNDVYPPMKKALLAAGYTCEHHAARQTTRADYGEWDYIIGMDDENMWDMKHIYGGDPDRKLSMLLDWAGTPGREIDDPWYTRDFTGVLRQIEDGCRGLLTALRGKKQQANVFAVRTYDEDGVTDRIGRRRHISNEKELPEDDTGHCP